MGEMKEKKQLVRYLLTFFVRGGGIILTFAVSIILARIYGTNISGEYYVIYNFRALILALAFMGYNYVIVHYCAPLYKKEEYEQGNVMLSYSVYSVLILTVCIVGGMILFSDIIARVLLGTSEYGATIKLTAIMLVPAAMASILGEVFKAIGKTNMSIVISNIMVYFVFSILILRRTDGGINIVIFKEVIAYIVAIIIVVFWNYKDIKRYRIKIVSFRSMKNIIKSDSECGQLIKSFSRENFILAAINTSNVILTVYDTLVIGALLSATEVALFSVANKITAIGSVCLTTVNAIVGYQFATMANEKEQDKLNKLFIFYTRVLAILSFAFIVIVFCFAPLVPMIYGAEYSECITYIRYLSIGQFILIATGPSAYFLIMTGYAKEYRRIVVISAVVTILTSFLGAKYFGIQGVIFSNVIVVVIKNVWSLGMVLKTRKMKIIEFLRRGDTKQ